MHWRCSTQGSQDVDAVILGWQRDIERLVETAWAHHGWIDDVCRHSHKHAPAKVSTRAAGCFVVHHACVPGRLVAAITNTSPRESRPSISVKSWLTTAHAKACCLGAEVRESGQLTTRYLARLRRKTNHRHDEDTVHRARQRTPRKDSRFVRYRVRLCESNGTCVPEIW